MSSEIISLFCTPSVHRLFHFILGMNFLSFMSMTDHLYFFYKHTCKTPQVRLSTAHGLWRSWQLGELPRVMLGECPGIFQEVYYLAWEMPKGIVWGGEFSGGRKLSIENVYGAIVRGKCPWVFFWGEYLEETSGECPWELSGRTVNWLVILLAQPVEMKTSDENNND